MLPGPAEPPEMLPVAANCCCRSSAAIIFVVAEVPVGATGASLLPGQPEIDAEPPQAFADFLRAGRDHRRCFSQQQVVAANFPLPPFQWWQMSRWGRLGHPGLPDSPASLQGRLGPLQSIPGPSGTTRATARSSKLLLPIICSHHFHGGTGPGIADRGILASRTARNRYLAPFDLIRLLPGPAEPPELLQEAACCCC